MYQSLLEFYVTLVLNMPALQGVFGMPEQSLHMPEYA